MSFQDGNTQPADATIPELELNKETLRDLEVDGSDVKGGSNACAIAGRPTFKLEPTVIRMYPTDPPTTSV